MADHTVGVINVVLADLACVETTLTTALEQVDTARVSLIAYRDAAEGGGDR